MLCSFVPNTSCSSHLPIRWLTSFFFSRKIKVWYFLTFHLQTQLQNVLDLKCKSAFLQHLRLCNTQDNRTYTTRAGFGSQYSDCLCFSRHWTGASIIFFALCLPTSVSALTSSGMVAWYHSTTSRKSKTSMIMLLMRWHSGRRRGYRRGKKKKNWNSKGKMLVI